MANISLNEDAIGRAGRIDWLDTAKGLGIVLLVILHVKASSSAPYSETIVWFLKLFRMPMFFIISGMLFSSKPTLYLVDGKFRSLIIPYISYIILILSLLFINYIVTGDDSTIFSSEGIFGLFWGGEALTGKFGVFWFITCLFFCQILYNKMIHLFGGIFSWKFAAAIGAVLPLGYILAWSAPDFASPLAIGVVPFGLPLMWFGGLLRTGIMTISIKILLTTTVLTSAIVAAYLGGTFDMDLKYAEPGIPLLSLLLAMALTWLFIELCRLASRLPGVAFVSAELSGASMAIMFMHQFVHFTLRSLGASSDLLIIILCVGSCYVGWHILKRMRSYPAFSSAHLEGPRELGGFSTGGL